MPTTVATIPRGTIVRFTRGPLGCLVDVNDTVFAEHCAQAGDLGLYDGPHPYKGLGDRWHVVSVAVEGRTLFVPVHDAQFAISDVKVMER